MTGLTDGEIIPFQYVASWLGNPGNGHTSRTNRSRVRSGNRKRIRYGDCNTIKKNGPPGEGGPLWGVVTNCHSLHFTLSGIVIPKDTPISRNRSLSSFKLFRPKFLVLSISASVFSQICQTY